MCSTKLCFVGCSYIPSLTKLTHGFFSLTTRSIAPWQQFETDFLSQFRDEKTFGVLFLDISGIKYDKKDKVKEFNQIFINLLN